MHANWVVWNEHFSYFFIVDLKSRLARGGAGGGVPGIGPVPGFGSPDSNSDRVSVLEKKLFAVQEELTEMHRRRSEHAQQIIDQVSEGDNFVFQAWLVYQQVAT